MVAVKQPAAGEPRTALVAGGSGLTGAALLRRLVEEDYTRVLALSRRPLSFDHPRLANRILRFDELERSLRGQRCTDAFCTLGAAGGPRAAEAGLQQVDLALTVAFARAARAAGATRLVVVSAAGADPQSPQPFARVKGQMEAALRELGFAALDVMRPGMVYGGRPADGLTDTLRLAALTVTGPLLRRSKHMPDAISGDALAAAMTHAARSQRRGVNWYAGEQLTGSVARRRG